MPAFKPMAWISSQNFFRSGNFSLGWSAWVGPEPERLRSAYELLLETFAPGSG